MNGLTKIVVKIEGMHCSSCAMSIDFELEDLEGVEQANTSFAKQETEIVFDGKKVSLRQILEQIKANGYTPSVKG